MTIEELMYEASEACIDVRESYLILFKEGLNGYVCRNEGTISEAKALFRGTYRGCQVWVERRGIAAALAVVQRRIGELEGVPEGRLAGRALLDWLAAVAGQEDGAPLG